ncbi:MAG: prepilin peptidase [Lentisphaeria bacterium]|nr:prepilin peptidase [Lentisphaeria bacterium]
MLEQFEILKKFFMSLPWEQIWIEATSTRVYVEVMRKYQIFSGIVIFWLGCNIGSFLNVCIYRLPLKMSLFRPKSHCPKCNHQLSWYENIPLFSYLFLWGSCKECGIHISPRYWIVELTTGLLFAASYLKVSYLQLPLPTMLLMFFVISILLCCAFTDCDLRVIPDTLTITAMIIVPVYYLLHKGLFPLQPDWKSLWICLANMAGAAFVMSAFTLLGRLLFKRDAFGWGDVKYLVVVAGTFGWFPTVLILAASSVIAMIYMPIYWCFRPKRKRRGFAFAPFMTICAFIWMFSAEFVMRSVVLFFRKDGL